MNLLRLLVSLVLLLTVAAGMLMMGYVSPAAASQPTVAAELAPTANDRAACADDAHWFAHGRAGPCCGTACLIALLPIAFALPVADRSDGQEPDPAVDGCGRGPERLLPPPKRAA